MQNLAEQFTTLANSNDAKTALTTWTEDVIMSSVAPERLACDDALARLSLAKPADMAQRKLLGRDYVYAGIDY